MNFARIFEKYHVSLPFPDGIIDDGERKLNCAEAEHLFSYTRQASNGCIAGIFSTWIQEDYYKSKKGNFVVITRDLNRNDCGRPTIEVISEKKFESDYRLAYRYHYENTILYDAYNKKPTLEEV